MKIDSDKDIFLASRAQVIGNVHIGENVGIWYNAVVRGDMEGIAIGDNTNVQDNCTLHTGNGFAPTIGKGLQLDIMQLFMAAQ